MRKALFLALALCAGGLEAQPRGEKIPFPDLGVLEPKVAEQLGKIEELLRATLAEDRAGPAELAEIYGELGRHYHAYGLQDAAAASYRNALRLAREDFRWPYYLGNVHQATGRGAAAREAFLRAQEIFPDSLAVAIHLGELALVASHVDEAEAHFRKALRGDPSLPAAHAGLGQVALSKRNFAAAVEELEKALAEVPEANRLHYPLALAYRGLGQEDEARKHLAKRGDVGVRPPDPLMDELLTLRTGERVHLLRGRSAFAARRYREAAAEFRLAVEAAPESSRARVNLASALAEGGDAEGAMVELRRAIEFDPAGATARYNLGSLLARAGQSEEAVAHLQQAIELDPTDRQALFELADLLRGGDRPADALPLYRLALEIDPDNERALVGEADSLARAGRYGEAARRLEESLSRLPGSGLVAHALARLLAAAPDLEIRDGQRALDLAGRVFAARNSPRHAATVALALAELGRCDEAANWQQQALEAKGDEASDAERQALESYRMGPPCRP